MPEDFTPQTGADDNGSSFDEFLARYMAGERARAERSIDLSRFLSARTQEVLQRAGRFALERGQRELDALHVLRILVAEDPAKDAVQRIGADWRAIARATEERLPAAVRRTGGRRRCRDHRRPSSERSSTPSRWRAPRARPTSTPSTCSSRSCSPRTRPPARCWRAPGVTAEALTQGMRETVAPSGATVDRRARRMPRHPTPRCSTRFGTDLTARARAGELDPVIGRADEIEQTIEILSRRTKNNPVLVGEAGVGKTAIVEGLASAIVAGAVPEQLRDKRVIALDLPGMLAGTRYRGDFEERLTKTMDEIAARKGELIVFIDEVHTVVGAGGGGEGAMDAGNILKPRLARGELHLVGATTLKEYRVIEKDPALERRFQPVQGRRAVHRGRRADPPRTEARVRGAPRHHLHRRRAARRRRARRPLPHRARAARQGDRPHRPGRCAAAAAPRRRKVDVSALMTRLGELEAEKNAAVGAERYEEASRIRDQIAEVQARLDDVSSRSARSATGASRGRRRGRRSPRSSAVPPASRSTASPRPSASGSRPSRTSCTTA